MKKAVLFVLAALLVLTSLGGCASEPTPAAPTPAAPVPGAPTPADSSPKDFKPMTLQIGHPNPSSKSDQLQFLCETFAQNVSDATGGAVKIEVLGDSQLGAEVDMLEGVKLGTVDMAVITNGVISTMNPSSQITELPFLFKDYDAAHKFLDDKVLDSVKADILKNIGAVVLGYGECGFRETLNNIRPITSVADYKGIKMRVMESPIFIRMFNLLGANPTPMAWSETFTAVQQGTVDGVEIPIGSIYSSQIYTACKYMDMTNHLFTSNGVLIGENIWKDMSPELQRIFYDSAQDAIVQERKFMIDSEEKKIDEIEKSGTIVNRNVDTSTMREAVKPLYEEYRKTIGENFFDSAMKVIDELNAAS